MDENEMIEDKEQMARIIAFDLCPQRYHKELYGENAKCYSDNNFGDCAKIKGVVDKLYNANCRIIADDEIVIAKRQYKQLKKYNRDRKRLRLKWKQAKQDLDDIYSNGFVLLVEHHEIVDKVAIETRQETVREILQVLKDNIVNSIGTKYAVIDLTDITQLAKENGIELED